MNDRSNETLNQFDNPDFSHNTVGFAKTTMRDRLRWWLFPKQICELPEAPTTYQDVLHIHTIVICGWLDRIRFLFSGRIQVETKTIAEIRTFLIESLKQGGVAE